MVQWFCLISSTLIDTKVVIIIHLPSPVSILIVAISKWPDIIFLFVFHLAVLHINIIVTVITVPLTLEAESSELSLVTSAWSFTLSPSLPISIWDFVPLLSPSWIFVCQNLITFAIKKKVTGNDTWPLHYCGRSERRWPRPCSGRQGRSRNQSMSRTSWWVMT